MLFFKHQIQKKQTSTGAADTFAGWLISTSLNQMSGEQTGPGWHPERHRCVRLDEKLDADLPRIQIAGV